MMILFWQESLSFSSWSEVLKQKFSVDFDNALHVLPKLIATPQNGPKGPQSLFAYLWRRRHFNVHGHTKASHLLLSCHDKAKSTHDRTTGRRLNIAE